MNLEITKKDFDQAVPAAKEPKGKIFEALQGSIEEQKYFIEAELLGIPGVTVVDTGEDAAAERLRRFVKQLVCVSAFVGGMRGLDLVLTATGFGVVSTQDTAPASKMRVDALEGELRRKERLLRSFVVAELFRVEGWSTTVQCKNTVQTLFWSFSFLQSMAAISNPKPEDWDKSVPAMIAADNYLRKHIGEEYMEQLISQLTSNTLTDENRMVAVLCQRFIGAWIVNDHMLKEELYTRLINLMEADLSKYPAYAGSEAYKLNHFKPYENHAEDSAFHFVG